MNRIKAQSTTDQELLQGMLHADRAAIRQIYDSTLPAVILWVAQNSGTEADARDIFQEALLALFRRLEQGDFELRCQLKSYLRIMCRNLWMTRIRDRKPLSPLSEEEEQIALDRTVQEQLEQSEKRQLFLKHFDQLEAGCKQILSLFFDKVPLKEIAEKMNTSVSYIKKRKFVCKERLVKAIQNDRAFREMHE